MDLRLGVMDNLNMAGAVAIEKIQHTFKGYDSVMHGVTEIGNSAHTFSLLIPVAAAIDMNLACDLLVSATVGEWTSTLLKWYKCTMPPPIVEDEKLVLNLKTLVTLSSRQKLFSFVIHVVFIAILPNLLRN